MEKYLAILKNLSIYKNFQNYYIANNGIENTSKNSMELVNLDYEVVSDYCSPIEQIMQEIIWILEGRHGLHFENQVSFGKYTVDFLCKEIKLIIECDGFAYHSQYEQLEKDKIRDRFFIQEGYKTMRFLGKEILDNPFGVLEDIREVIKKENKK